MDQFDVVEGIIEPYGNRFRLWGATGKVYQKGDEVPPVGMSESYAVRLESPEGTKPGYLWVSGGHISNLIALQPIYEKAVFDRWGRYLGRGGEELDSAGAGPVAEAVSILEEVTRGKPPPREMAQPMTAPLTARKLPAESEPDSEPEPEPEVTEEEPAGALQHRFYLRPDFIVKLKLPADLTESEADRLRTFIASLPFRFA